MGRTLRILIGAALTGAVLGACSLHQESDNFGGLPVRNETTGAVRVVYLTQSPPATLEPIPPGNTLPSYIPTGTACDTRNDYGAVNEEGHLIARIHGSCDVSSPWVITTPTLTVRNNRNDRVTIRSGTGDGGPATIVGAGAQSLVPLQTDKEGCDSTRALTARSDTGEVLVTRSRSCVGEVWEIN